MISKESHTYLNSIHGLNWEITSYDDKVVLKLKYPFANDTEITGIGYIVHASIVNKVNTILKESNILTLLIAKKLNHTINYKKVEHVAFKIDDSTFEDVQSAVTLNEGESIMRDVLNRHRISYSR